MRTRTLGVVVLVLMGSLAASCSKGGKGGKTGDDADGMKAYDEDGKEKPCPEPESACEERKEAGLAFKDACGLKGYRIQLCGCEELCTGNATGARTGYDRKNKKKDCEPPKETCPEGEESAAFQDACSDAGGELLECGCTWLCSDKLKEALPDPASEKSAEESKDGDKKDGDKDDKKSDKDDKKKDDKKSDKDDKKKDDKKSDKDDKKKDEKKDDKKSDKDDEKKSDKKDDKKPKKERSLAPSDP